MREVLVQPDRSVRSHRCQARPNPAGLRLSTPTLGQYPEVRRRLEVAEANLERSLYRHSRSLPLNADFFKYLAHSFPVTEIRRQEHRFELCRLSDVDSTLYFSLKNEA